MKVEKLNTYLNNTSVEINKTNASENQELIFPVLLIIFFNTIINYNTNFLNIRF